MVVDVSAFLSTEFGLVRNSFQRGPSTPYTLPRRQPQGAVK